MEYGYNPKERKQIVSASFNAQELYDLAIRFRKEGFLEQAEKIDEVAEEFRSIVIFLDERLNDRT